MIKTAGSALAFILTATISIAANSDYLTNATTTKITIDGKSGGLVFDGVGAVSSGGSSRLLIDYPEPQRRQILDYLFKPNYGAALQILKVEIGADTDATCGAEPSHQRSPDKIQCDLGYEWWLMKEAKARNPEIKLCGLAWGAPGWLRDGFWSDDNVRYTLAWLDCAKKNGLRIDYLGGGNERGWNAEYYVKLRNALNEQGHSHIKLIATDDHNPPDYWAVATEMKTNRAFANAVDILGEHDVCGWRTLQRHCFVSQDALALGKPLWDSENSTQDYAIGFDPLARAMNRHYIDGRITANLNWSLVGAYYGNFPAPGTGLLLADRPWSGWYDIGKSVWVDAHTTQFAKPGWRYLDSACGYTPNGASYVTLQAPGEGQSGRAHDYSMVIETMDLSAPEILEVTVTGGLSCGKVHLWQTDLRSESDRDFFVKAGTIKPSAGSFRIRIEPGHLYTLSTTSGQSKGNAHSKSVAGERMPLPFREDFESVGAHRLAKYFCDVHGGFEVARCGGGRKGNCYRQMLTREPILWHKAKMPPTMVVGDPCWWGDYEVGVDALLEDAGYVELLGRIESQQHNIAGYHFQMRDTGAWSLYTQDEKGKDRFLASGADERVGIDQWHRLTLHFRRNEITALLDGRELADVHDDSHVTGQVGLRVSPWQHAQFDNLEVRKTTLWPDFIPHTKMTAIASSESATNDFGAIHVARNAMDDRVETSWRSLPAPLPQSITLDLKHPRKIRGLACRPELADGGQRRIIAYKVYASLDGNAFEEIAKGESSVKSTMVVTWQERRVRFLRLEATKAGGEKGVAIGELDVF